MPCAGAWWGWQGDGTHGEPRTLSRASRVGGGVCVGGGAVWGVPPGGRVVVRGGSVWWGWGKESSWLDNLSQVV